MSKIKLLYRFRYSSFFCHFRFLAGSPVADASLCSLLFGQRGMCSNMIFIEWQVFTLFENCTTMSFAGLCPDTPAGTLSLNSAKGILSLWNPIINCFYLWLPPLMCPPPLLLPLPPPLELLLDSILRLVT